MGDTAWKSIPRTPRQLYRWTSIVYQAKELSSVDSSGLSNPMVKLGLGSMGLCSGHKEKTCHPTWFEAYDKVNVVLPADLRLAPDIVAVVYHKPNANIARNQSQQGDSKDSHLLTNIGGSISNFFVPAYFMGSCRIPCSQAIEGKPHWYPLEFEEHQFGSLLLSNTLKLEGPTLRPRIKIDAPIAMLAQWPRYTLKARSLALRGLLQKKIGKSKDVYYQLECMSYSTSITAEQEFKKRLLIPLPDDPIFLSAVNVRVYSIKRSASKAQRANKENFQLEAVSSISIQQLLKPANDWFRVLDLVCNTKQRARERALSRLKRAYRAKTGPIKDYNDRLKYNYVPVAPVVDSEENHPTENYEENITSGDYNMDVPLLSMAGSASPPTADKGYSSSRTDDHSIEMTSALEAIADKRAGRPRVVRICFIQGY